MKLLFVLMAALVANAQGESISTRVIGGDVVKNEEYPHVVALLINDGTLCAGSIIEENIILTAAHCVQKHLQKPENIRVIAGEVNLKAELNDQQNLTVKQIVSHESYNSTTHENDIALLVLTNKLAFDASTQKIDLKNDCTDASNGGEATVAGWGKFSGSSSDRSSVLRAVTNKVITFADCQPYFTGITLTKNHICLDGSRAKSACLDGDGGAALFVKDSTTEVKQIGIVSFATKWGCDYGYPMIYTNVGCFHNNWIKVKIADINGNGGN